MPHALGDETSVLSCAIFPAFRVEQGRHKTLELLRHWHIAMASRQAVIMSVINLIQLLQRQSHKEL